MAIFSLFKYNQSNRIDVRIGDGTVKITTILTVRAMITFEKKYGGRTRNKSGEGAKTKIGGGAMLPMPPRWRRAYIQCKGNKDVNVLSTYVGKKEQKKAKRYSQKEKKGISILLPKVVNVYNKCSTWAVWIAWIKTILAIRCT